MPDYLRTSRFDYDREMYRELQDRRQTLDVQGADVTGKKQSDYEWEALKREHLSYLQAKRLVGEVDRADRNTRRNIKQAIAGGVVPIGVIMAAIMLPFEALTGIAWVIGAVYATIIVVALFVGIANYPEDSRLRRYQESKDLIEAYELFKKDDFDDAMMRRLHARLENDQKALAPPSDKSE